MNNQASEKRHLDAERSELRLSDEGVVSGYAMVFNSRSRLLYGQFYERIVPEAMEGVIERSDVLALLNHDSRRGILGRWTQGKGTLRLEVDDKGLYYEFTPPETSLGNEVREYLRRGEIDSSSFGFKLAARGGDRFERRSDGKLDRTITKFEIIDDVSVVYRAAYQETSANIRSLEVYLEENDPERLAEYYREKELQIQKLKQK